MQHYRVPAVRDEHGAVEPDFGDAQLPSGWSGALDWRADVYAISTDDALPFPKMTDVEHAAFVKAVRALGPRPPVSPAQP